MSLENLDKILPAGVTSKNKSGARMMPCNNVTCITTAAYQQPSFGIKSQNIEPNAEIEKQF